MAPPFESRTDQALKSPANTIPHASQSEMGPQNCRWLCFFSSKLLCFWTPSLDSSPSQENPKELQLSLMECISTVNNCW